MDRKNLISFSSLFLFFWMLHVPVDEVINSRARTIPSLSLSSCAQIDTKNYVHTQTRLCLSILPVNGDLCGGVVDGGGGGGGSVRDVAWQGPSRVNTPRNEMEEERKDRIVEGEGKNNKFSFVSARVWESEWKRRRRRRQKGLRIGRGGGGGERGFCMRTPRKDT